MHDKNELCQKIKDVFPELGTCNIDLKVNYDEAQKAWAVDLTKGNHHLKTFLELDEADMCMDGKQCVSLGLQIGQLRKNIETL